MYQLVWFEGSNRKTPPAIHSHLTIAVLNFSETYRSRESSWWGSVENLHRPEQVKPRKSLQH